MRRGHLLAGLVAAALWGCGETPAETAAPGGGGPGAGGSSGSGGSGSGGSGGSAGSGGAAGAGGFAGEGGSGGAGGGPDLSAALFAPDHLVEVVIELPAADWDALRLQTRTIFEVLAGDCLSHPPASPYDWFEGRVTVDGQTVERAGIRKKGFIGSLDSEKPSLKLGFDELVPGTELHGVEKLTLNNAKQDPAIVRQCLAYGLFSRAGLPASRCNFAHVTVNGQDLGVYVNVEAASKRMIGRHFADDGGNLYEGTLSDFREGWTGTFDRKTNEADPDRSDLGRAVTAVAAPDDQLLAAVDGAFDLDQFLSYWAMEVLTSAWDGYASNTNNFYLYADPSDGRFRFLPWGIDMSFVAGNPFEGETPLSVAATGMLARRLYFHPEGQTRYLARLRELLATTWDEDELVAEVDRLELLLTPALGPVPPATFRYQLTQLRGLLRGRRGVIEAELFGGAPVWPLPPKEPFCIEQLGNISGSFSTTFGTLAAPDPFRSGSGTLTVEYLGQSQSPTPVGGNCGMDPNAQDGPRVLVQQVGRLLDGRYAVSILSFPPELARPGTTFLLDWAPSLGALLVYDPRTDTTEQAALFGGGTVTLDQISLVDGEPVTGSYSSPLLEWIF